MSLRILKHSRWLVLFLTILFLKSFSQDGSVVVSPSPSSSSIARYSEIPVDLSTGVPQISIPIHVIESSKLSYPISISYHGSGIKVNDVAGPVGTGWTLNAGGQINRIMRNRPDEQANGFFSFASSIPNETDPIDLTTKSNVSTRTTDMMPDLFYYNTGTTGGTMIFDNQVIARTIPRNSLTITTNTATLATFTLTTPAGENFEFDPGETATASVSGTTLSFTYIASWYLSRIVSADKLDTIRFNYNPISSSYSYTTSENLGINFFYNAPPGAARAFEEINALNSNVNVTVTGTRYLANIVHKGGKVSFSFSGGRSDDPNGKKLDQIIVYSKDPVSGTLVQDKKINFSYSYFQNTDTGTRLRLDSFIEQLDATTFNPPYSFAYSVKKLPAPASSAQDHWGYYNGAETNANLIPAYTQGFYVLSTNNREVNSSFVDGCMLKSITSPYAGVTEFVFESNKYLSGTTDTYGPGLRISKIIKRDPFTAINAITNYEYKNPTSGKSSGLLMNTPNYFTDIPVVDNIHGNGFHYNCLLIKVNATTVGNFSGAPVIYEYVTTYTNDDVNATGKVVSKFSVYTPPTIAFPYFPVNDNSWTAGNLLTQEVYKVQSNVSTLVKKIENTYLESPYFYSIKGLSVAANKIFFFDEPDVNDFVVKNYLTYSKFQYLSESKVYDYEQNSGTINLLTTRTNYYDKTNIHLFPTKTEVTTSGSDKIKNEFTYVADYPSTGVFAVMNNLNMKGVPVDVTTSLVKGGTDYITGYQKTEYYEWKPNKVYPKNFYDAKLALNTAKSSFLANPGNYTRLNSKINAYNKSGVAAESEVVGNKPQSIIVDKNINRVTASTDVSSANQIAYSSFESRDYGNWKIATGTTTTTKNVNLTLSNTFESIVLQNTQTVNYTYTITKSNGASPFLIFSKEGTTPITKYLTGASGSGSVSLTAGNWNVYLEFDLNVTAITASFSYQLVSPNAPSIVTSQLKTGNRSLQLGGSQTISRDSLPSGNYTVIFYQKGGTVTVTPTGGASVTSTVTSTAEADGWTKVQKEISISALSQSIQITGTTSIYIDELRLHPSGAFMSTTCYDVYKNVTTKTDMNLRSQFIEYDSHRRVYVIRDHDKNILQQYDYNLAIN